MNGQNTSRQYINANTPDLVAIFGGNDKIQFHQIMEKLQDHLFEVDPIVIEFEIGKESGEEGRNIQKKWYETQVDCFSSS